MKNLINIFLICCFILPFIGSVSYLNYQKKKIKRQIKHDIIAGIDKDELVLFSFTLEETQSKLKWKHAKEFEYNGSMYDIVDTDTSNNIITFWCWWDYKETKLNKQLTKLLAQFLGNDTHNKETKSQLRNFLDTLFYLKNEPWKASINTTKKLQLYSYINNYSSLKIASSSPPPRHS